MLRRENEGKDLVFLRPGEKHGMPEDGVRVQSAGKTQKVLHDKQKGIRKAGL